MCCGAKAAPAAKLQESRERSYLETEDSDSVETGFGHLSVAPGGPCRVWKLDKKTRLILKTRHLFFFKESARGCQAVVCWYPFFWKNTCQGFDMSRCAQLKWGLAPRLWHSLTLHQWHRHLGTTRGSGMPSNPGNHRDDAVFFLFLPSRTPPWFPVF